MSRPEQAYFRVTASKLSQLSILNAQDFFFFFFLPFLQEILLARQNFFPFFFFAFIPLIFICVSLLQGAAWTGPGEGGHQAASEKEACPLLRGSGSKTGWWASGCGLGFLLVCVCVFLGLHWWPLEVPRLGVESEL